MDKRQAAKRLISKTTLHTIQVELQEGYNLSPVEAHVLARRVQELVDEQTGLARQPGQITYQAIAIHEPPGKPLSLCRRVPVHLTLSADDDAEVWAQEGSVVLRQLRVHRLVYEALMQGGALSQEDLACVLGVSSKTIKRIFAFYREQDHRLPSRGEIQDMGRGVSHKVPIIRKYVQDLSLSWISLELGRHGIASMTRYLRHFALVMVLEDRGLTVEQMQSIIGISRKLIEQYRALYAELNVPEHERVLGRLRGTILSPLTGPEIVQESLNEPATSREKGGRS
jgi:hypothetical protein